MFTRVGDWKLDCKRAWIPDRGRIGPSRWGQSEVIMEQETTKRGLLELRQVIRDQIAKAEKELEAIDLLLSNWFDSEPDAPPSEPDAPPE